MSDNGTVRSAERLKADKKVRRIARRSVWTARAAGAIVLGVSTYGFANDHPEYAAVAAPLIAGSLYERKRAHTSMADQAIKYAATKKITRPLTSKLVPDRKNRKLVEVYDPWADPNPFPYMNGSTVMQMAGGVAGALDGLAIAIHQAPPIEGNNNVYGFAVAASVVALSLTSLDTVGELSNPYLAQLKNLDASQILSRSQPSR